MPGTAYVLFHHVMGECDGARGVWGYVRGGMGGLTGALASAAKGYGAEIRTDAGVARILVRDRKVSGVVLANGTEILADRVASNADANVTFNKLIEAKELPPEFLDDLRAIDYNSMSLKINVALSEPPNFTALPCKGVGPHHHGTMHIGPSLDYMERAYDDAKYGRPSENPILECTMPSALDPSVAPPGQHLMGMFIQYAPTTLRDGNWDEVKDAFARRCFDLMNEYAPNFKNSILNYQVLSPLDLERTFGLTGGNIMQGAMHLHSLFFMRPVPGYADYRTPVKGLYLCGAAAHPGGGVMGASGYNAAREILRDGRK
jgi:phytoene dehydrogenase-like protein